MADPPGQLVPAGASGVAPAEPALAGVANAARRRHLVRLSLFATWGTGLVVMLADTDAGSLVTAGQSGARWGYRMILPQLVLIPVLYVTQEMTVRLGIVTGKGHGALIRERFGRGWGLVSAISLFVSAIGALLTELAGIAGVGALFGVPPLVSVPLATVFLLSLMLTGSYRRVERIAIAVGLAEVLFLVAMTLSHPNAGAALRALGSVPLGHSSYLLLVAANIGAVVMPWMVFYQQGAVIDKGLTTDAIRQVRRDTGVGAVLTQAVMVAVVVSVAATIGLGHPRRSLHTVGQMATVLTGALGHLGGTVLFGVGMLGAALVAAIVSSIAGAWGLAEVFGWQHTLNERPSRSTARFYLAYAAVHVLGAVLVLANTDLIRLSIDVELMNALLLPVVLGFLLALEARALPLEWRMRGARKVVTWALCLGVVGFSLALAPATLGVR
ncbi:MAG: divalent metal cation transporter [Actinomycetota bacterium]|jgi:Mn2+/Fe2+ NRAMP family transporter|nr:divalent metal cation transporter [Actinomycetota bacterium]